MRRLVPLIALAGALSLAGCQKSHAASDDDKAFGERVRAYLLAHPEVLQEATQRLEAKLAAQDEAEQHAAQKALPSLRAAVERDPRDFVANPGGTITVTEFYDYRCPHCVNAAPNVVALIRQHPDVRFVFKEMPIFGPVSEHAARAALAVKKAGGDYVGLYQAYMSARGLDDQTIDRLALAKGALPADLAPAAVHQNDAHLAANAALFTKLDLEGTPAFIVGDQFILGDDMKALNAALANAHAAKGVQTAKS
ncbi:MAG TPA: thioredoxin domain-containing protein [Caulobacteraceae bacterium]|nr:thioredoxin domain-containing protein [Caulobacteraceae bacterium]